MLKEFKQFIMRGNVVDMAVGIIMGTAFGAIVKSLVEDVIMPPIGVLLGGLDFASLAIVLRTTPEEVAIRYGAFINTIINFLIVAVVVFLLVRVVNRLRLQKPAEVVTKECPHCLSAIPLKATRCPHCTSQLEPLP